MPKQVIDKPWLNRRIWRGGQYKNNTFKSFAFMSSTWLIAALLCGYLIYAMGSSLYAGDVKVTIGSMVFSLFILVGLPVLLFYFFIHVLKAWRRWRMWRNSLFEHYSMPAYLGAQLEGKLMLPDHLKDGETLSYSLGCFRQRRYQRERVDNKGTSLWQSETVKKLLDPMMKSISIQIDLPKSRPESKWSGSYGHIKWLLSIQTANDNFKNIDYEVPVFFNPCDL